MTAEVAKIIDDGLRWYEEELWHDRPVKATTMDETVKVISQEEMKTLRANTERKTSVNEAEGINQNTRSQVEKGKTKTLQIITKTFF
jgi:hypothetical protein